MKKNKISKEWINRQHRDIYVKKSKQEGYRSRAVYKLQEINEKFKILKTIAAGDNPYIKKVPKLSCIEVMTGAIIKKPFDTIIPIEDIEFFPSKQNAKYIILTTPNNG